VKFVDEWKNQDSFRYINFTKHSQNANQSIQKSFEDGIVFDSLKKKCASTKFSYTGILEICEASKLAIIVASIPALER